MGYFIDFPPPSLHSPVIEVHGISSQFFLETEVIICNYLGLALFHLHFPETSSGKVLSSELA